MFMQIAVGAIGIGIVLMIGYLIMSSVKGALPTPQIANSCYNKTIVSPCVSNTSLTMDDTTFVNAISGTQTTIYAGLALIAVGIIVLAAFGLIAIFK